MNDDREQEEIEQLLLKLERELIEMDSEDEELDWLSLLEELLELHGETELIEGELDERLEDSELWLSLLLLELELLLLPLMLLELDEQLGLVDDEEAMLEDELWDSMLEQTLLEEQE